MEETLVFVDEGFLSKLNKYFIKVFCIVLIPIIIYVYLFHLDPSLKRIEGTNSFKVVEKSFFGGKDFYIKSQLRRTIVNLFELEEYSFCFSNINTSVVIPYSTEGGLKTYIDSNPTIIVNLFQGEDKIFSQEVKNGDTYCYPVFLGDIITPVVNVQSTFIANEVSTVTESYLAGNLPNINVYGNKTIKQNSLSLFIITFLFWWAFLVILKEIWQIFNYGFELKEMNKIGKTKLKSEKERK